MSLPEAVATAAPPPVLLTALLGPDDLDAVLDVLEAHGVEAFTVTEARGRRAAGDDAETYKGVGYRLRLAARTKVEAVVAAADSARVREGVMRAATHLALGAGDIVFVDLVAARRLALGA